MSDVDVTRAKAGTSARRAAAASRRLKFFSTQRVGLHQLAYLRGLAEGLEGAELAKRYLGIDHAAQLARVHRETVELVRAVARRSGHRKWRLIGIEIPAAAPAPTDGAQALPTVSQWAEEQGLDDWGEDELLTLFQERFADQLARPPSDPQQARREARNQALREARLELLKDLQNTVVEAATPQDDVAAWFSGEIVRRLRVAGAVTLGDLQARIRRGGRWWRGIPAIGAGKAQLIAAHVQRLLAAAPAAALPADAPRCASLSEIGTAGRDLAALGRGGANRAPMREYRVLQADTDVEAVEAWLKVRCTSKKTRISYEREMRRFRLWLWGSRRHALSDATVEDCQAYIELLRAVPESWMSSRNVGPGEPGWAPFRTQPSVPSQQLAINILAGAFGWLRRTGYLQDDPWEAVNRRLGDADDDWESDDDVDDPTTRAFTPAAWAALVDQVAIDAAQPKTAAGAPRMAWLLQFCEATGLRADELLRARRGSLVQRDGLWRLRVVGKGRRRRRIPVPRRIIELTRSYFDSRGLDFNACDRRTPLLGATTATDQQITYSALSQAFKGLLRRAAVRLPPDDAQVLRGASLHWLRHTHGTRSAERGMSANDIQTNFGHADVRTATGYTRAQLRRRAELIEEAFG